MIKIFVGLLWEIIQILAILSLLVSISALYNFYRVDQPEKQPFHYYLHPNFISHFSFTGQYSLIHKCYSINPLLLDSNPTYYTNTNSFQYKIRLNNVSKLFQNTQKSGLCLKSIV